MRFEIRLLGQFCVLVDGRPVDGRAWHRRQAAALVKVLALAPDRRLHREQVIDALWPELSVTEAAPRLHKAAHFARRAIGHDDAIVLSDMGVMLLPDLDVDIDVQTFEALAAAHDERALDVYGGTLLPSDLYEAWTELPRSRVERTYLELLRTAGRWSDVLAVDPADERAHLELMHAHLQDGDRTAALRQFEQLECVLHEELGTAPSAAALALRDEALDAGRTTHHGRAGRPPLTQVIRFCRSDDGTQLAYAELGDGPVLVKAATWLTHLEYDWESIVWKHWLHGLGERYRLIRYDERGCGLSDWDVDEFSLDAWVRDLETVVNNANLDRFPLLGISQGAAVAVEYAARHPERVSKLVLYGGYLHGPVRRARTDEQRRAAALLVELAELGWGMDDAAFRQVFAARFMPEGTHDQWRAFNELQRRSTSPANAGRFIRAFGRIDVAETATRVRAPTLVLHARDDLLPPLSQGRQLAALIPDSRFVSLESRNHLLLEHEPAWVRFLDEVDGFLSN